MCSVPRYPFFLRQKREDHRHLFCSFRGSVCSVTAHAPNPHVQPIFAAERVTPWNVRLRLTLAVALRACPPIAAAAGTRRDQKGQLPPGRGD